MKAGTSSTRWERWLVGVGCALAGIGAAAGVTLLKLASGRELIVWAALVAALGLGTAGAALFALRSLALRHLDRALAEQAAQSLCFDAAINNMSQGLCLYDGNRRLIVCNHRYGDIYKLPRELIRPGTTLEEIVDHRYANGCFPNMTRSAYLEWRNRISTQDHASDTIAQLCDGRVIAIHHEPMPGGGWVATHEDITERWRAEAQIERMARHDALTGLPNRLLFRERLEQHIGASDAAQPLAVLCVDLDRFKAVNDTLGHPVGDELLGAVARRLSDCVRHGDTVARLGGDEFAIIQTGAPQPASAVGLAERLVLAVAAPFDVGGHKVCIGASVGIALWPHDGRDADQLLKRADLALYAAKSAGGEQSRLFELQMDERAQNRRALETDLRQAIAKRELVVFYQPIFEVRRRRVVAFEALLRWNHPTRGMVMPDCFIALAEETGLIQQLGEWVLYEAFTQAARWPAAVGIAVNLSPVQLRSGDLVETVAAALAASGLAPERVDLEITESVLLVENSVNLAMLHRLLALGVHVSLDDFGVGFSSLSYLRSFPFSKLKIDRSFVRDVASNHQAAAIIRAIASLAAGLDMAIIAEGVEQAEQLDTLQALGCQQAQGYHLGRPGPASQADALLQREAVGDAGAAAPRRSLVDAT